MGDYDEETAFLGTWGRFQLMVFFLLSATAVPNGLNALSIVFMGDSPPHHCLIPEGVNLTEEWRQASIPTQVVNGQTEYSRCRRYRLDLISNYSALGLSPNKDVNLSQVPLEGCSDGWFYSKEIYQSTIVTEFDLVCGNEWKQPFTTSVYFIGVLTGSFFSGQLSDRFGRKPVLTCTLLITLFTFVQSFSPSWEAFTVFFFIVGLGDFSKYVTAFALGTEILSGCPRMIYASLGMCGFFAIGYMLLPLFAYFCRDWRMLLRALSVPSIVYLPFAWFIPESPRWLLSQGRVEEAEAILRDAAKKNRVKAPEVIFTRTEGPSLLLHTELTLDTMQVEDKHSKREKFHGFIELLKTSHIRLITLILCLVCPMEYIAKKNINHSPNTDGLHHILPLALLFKIANVLPFVIRFSLMIGYFGLSLNTSNLYGSPYLNCFISAVTEVPAYIASWLTLQYLPRRLSLSFCMFLGGGLLFIILLVPPDLPSLAISLAMLGKFFMAAIYGFIFGYTGELYPTTLRTTALGVCTMFSLFGSAIAPYLVHLGSYNKGLPYILLGSFGIISAISVLFLPETFGLPLPNTIEQMPKRERIKWVCLSSERENQRKYGENKSLKVLVETE